MNPTHKAYTFASRTSPVTNQSLQKSMLFPTLRKNKKSPPFTKNKTLPTLNPTDKNVMTETVDKQKGVSLDRKEGQLVTCGIFYCRDSAKINGRGSLRTSSRFDSEVLRNRQQNIPLSVSVHCKKTETDDRMKKEFLLHKDKEKWKCWHTKQHICKLRHTNRHFGLQKSCFLADAPDKMIKFGL